MKRINLTIGFLLLYFVIISIVAYPRERIVTDGTDQVKNFWLVCGLELIIIILLHRVLIKRHKMREQRRKEWEEQTRNEKESNK